MIVVINCGKQKATEARPAYALYTGSFFRTSMQWARCYAPQKNIYIISARYGIVRSTTVLQPYDQRIKRDVLSPALVKKQAKQFGIDKHKPLLIVGKRYMHLIDAVWQEYEAPFAGIEGFAMQQAMKRDINKTKHKESK